MKTYGYCRISTPKQNIARQVRNIKAAYPDAIIVQEVYTGTKFQGRREFDKILRSVQAGDTIVFDSVSRMSRTANDGFREYERLYSKGVSLVFLKEPHISTEVYRQALSQALPKTGTTVDFILEGINKYLMVLAEEQIRIAFEQAEKEVADLHQRTREGIETARLAGKQIGQIKGNTLITKKSVAAKKIIKQYNKAFGGQLDNEATRKLAGISHATFYKYKKELLREL